MMAGIKVDKEDFVHPLELKYIYSSPSMVLNEINK